MSVCRWNPYKFWTRAQNQHLKTVAPIPINEPSPTCFGLWGLGLGVGSLGFAVENHFSWDKFTTRSIRGGGVRGWMFWAWGTGVEPASQCVPYGSKCVHFIRKCVRYASHRNRCVEYSNKCIGYVLSTLASVLDPTVQPCSMAMCPMVTSWPLSLCIHIYLSIYLYKHRCR